MGIAIKIPQKYLDILSDIQNKTNEAMKSGDWSKLFSANNINQVLININEQEQFVRNQFIKQNNYIIDPSGSTELRFTGNYLIALFHGMLFLINAKAQPYTVRKQLMLDMEPYLMNEGTRDGACLSLLRLVVLSSIEKHDSTADAWPKCQEICKYMKSIDPNKLDWMSGYRWNSSISSTSNPFSDDIPKTPENIKKASVFFWDQYADYMKLYFNELYSLDQEEELADYLNNWADINIKAVQDPTIYPLYCTYYQQMLPMSYSFFERALSVIWMSSTISPLKKIEVISKVFKALDDVKPYIAGAFNKQNISILDQRKGREVVDRIELWIPKLFLQELCKENNKEGIINLLDKLKKINIYDQFINNLCDNINSIQSIISITNEGFQYLYKNVKAINDNNLIEIFVNAIKKCNLSSIADDLLANIPNSANINTEISHDNIAYVLTKHITHNRQSNIVIVHNKCSGPTTIYIDYDNGETETKDIMIEDFFSSISIKASSYVVVRTQFDTALVVSE